MHAEHVTIYGFPRANHSNQCQLNRCAMVTTTCDTAHNNRHVSVIVSFHKPVPMRPNYNITISMPINAYTKCVFALDSNANDGRCREPWKLTACIFISIQITISRDSSIICRRGCCYSFETMSQTNPNAIYDVFS